MEGAVMPVSLSIKNVPDEVVAGLRQRAKRNHRSLQGELLSILEQTVRPRRLSVEEAYHRAKALGLRTESEAVAMVREDRDAR